MKSNQDCDLKSMKVHRWAQKANLGLERGEEMRDGYRLSTQAKQEVKRTIHEGKPTLKEK